MLMPHGKTIPGRKGGKNMAENQKKQQQQSGKNQQKQQGSDKSSQNASNCK